MIGDYPELELDNQSDNESFTDDYNIIVNNGNRDRFKTSIIIYVFMGFFSCLFMFYFGIMIFICPKVLHQEMVFSEKCGEYQMPFFIFITMFFCLCTILMCSKIINRHQS